MTSKILKAFILNIILLAPGISLAAECIGPKDSTAVAVYLHGMDSDSPSSQEMNNRAILTSISKSLKMGFALPRAKDKCPDGKLLCWGWNFNDAKSVDAAITAAMSAKTECFPKATSVGLIGFSNGGSVANQIVKDCRKTEFNWLISIGAGGIWNKHLKRDLSKCGTLVLMAGKKDQVNFESIKDVANWLKTRGANSRIIEYNDGHTLSEKDLENVLKSVQQK